MPYAQNLLPRDPFPRGLGELAERAGGFGTWVVDMHWGLSPPFITGQNRPYGTPVVQTFYPRSQAPRLQNLQTGPVVAAGTWPDLLQADASPVFRTPVRRPGEQQLSLPPGAGVAGLAGGYSGTGYGHIPLGVAHPPTDMYERSLFARGTAGFGEEPSAGPPDNVTVLGMNYPVTPQDWQTLLANQAQLRRLLFSLYRIYAGLLTQIEHYNFVMGTFTATHPDYGQRLVYAENLVFGSPERHAQAATQYSALLRVREDLRAGVSPDQLAGMPADLRRAWDMFVNASAPTAPVTSGFGALPLAIPLVWTPWLIGAAKWAIGGVGVLLGVYAVTEMVGGVMGRRTQELEAQRQLEAQRSANEVNSAFARAVDALTEVIRHSPNSEERANAAAQVQAMQQAWNNTQRKVAEVEAAGGGWFMKWGPVVLGAGLIGALFVAMRWLGRGMGAGGGGGGERRSSRETVHAGGTLPGGIEVITRQIG